jgi:hypothetical protein
MDGAMVGTGYHCFTQASDSVRQFARFDICQEETVSMAKKASQLAKVGRTTEQQ